MPIHNNTGKRMRIKKHPLYLRIMVDGQGDFFSSMYTGYMPHTVDIKDGHLRVHHSRDSNDDIVQVVYPKV